MKSTVPVVLLERCVLPRQGRLFGNFGDSKEGRRDAQPLKGEYAQFFLESRKEMEDLKKDGRNGVTGEYPNSLHPIPHSSLFLFVNIRGVGAVIQLLNRNILG